MPPIRSEIAFDAEDATTLRGSLHVPEQPNRTALVMAHGFSGVRSQIEHYAVAFADRGYTVLLFDHRSFGTSDGAPRHEMDPHRQGQDWKAAITWMLGHPDLDLSGRVGIWGSSLAGGVAIAVGAEDDRVGCVVAQIPHVSGYRNASELYSPHQLAALRDKMRADRVNRLHGGEAHHLPVFTVSEDELCALPPAVSARYLKAVQESAPTWSNEVTLRSIENVLAFEPAGVVPYLGPTPFLMIVGDRDTCTVTHLQLDAYERATEPKQLVRHPGGHFDTYNEHFEQTARAAIDWFDRHLITPDTRTLTGSASHTVKAQTPTER